MLWIDSWRQHLSEQLGKRAPTERFVDVRLRPSEAAEILKALGGRVAHGATNGEIAGAIAARGNLLVLRNGKGN
jgi:hypothetical protein